MPPPRNIADRMDFRGAECREEFVADETVVDLEPWVLEPFDVRHCPDADDDDITVELGTVIQEHAEVSLRTVDLRDRPSENRMYAMPGVLLREEGANLVTEPAWHQVACRRDQGDIDSEPKSGRGDLGADEARSDDDDPAIGN